MKRISKITKSYNIVVGTQYEMELEKNYWFSFSGSYRTICSSINELYKASKSIVFCDGN